MAMTNFTISKLLEMSFSQLWGHPALSVPLSAIPCTVAVALVAMTALGMGIIKARDMLGANASADFFRKVPAVPFNLHPTPISERRRLHAREKSGRAIVNRTSLANRQLCNLDDAALHLMINNFVLEFLMPYLNGKITKENEPPGRQAMMDLLMAKINQSSRINAVDSKTCAKIENIALEAYLRIGAAGLFVDFATGKRRPPMNEKKRRYQFFTALQEALSKDFPNRKFEDEIIRRQAREALTQAGKPLVLQG